jgi:hypothetical protein
MAGLALLEMAIFGGDAPSPNPSIVTKRLSLPPETATFKPGPGSEAAMQNCLLCHSVDYISTQPPMTRAAWTATVVKMREKYGAPFGANQVEKVVDYLVKS